MHYVQRIGNIVAFRFFMHSFRSDDSKHDCRKTRCRGKIDRNRWTTTITATSGTLSNSSIIITTYPAVDNSTMVQKPLLVKSIAEKQIDLVPFLSLPGNGLSRLPVSKGNYIQVYDMMGHLIASGRNPDKINFFGHFPSGVYLIKVKKDGKDF
jgi:hypothetical protein